MTIRTCDICGKSSDTEEDVLLYGDWMMHQNITVHYFCLLLSTNLPQRGGDSSGILGFLLRDIRGEISAAKQRKCLYCQESRASISCWECGKFFHLCCGIEHHAFSEFCSKFRSFCEDCRPLDDYQRELIKNPPQPAPVCNICYTPILAFALHRVAYGDCCRKGFAHRTCMRQYALSSGYYLRCIWCRNEKFRDLIRLQSIFVPDRDATWERERNAYRELRTKHLTCQFKECLCPNGRDYSKYSWTILACKLCASAAAHVRCLPGSKKANETFKCETCEEVEKKLINNGVNCSRVGTNQDNINASYLMTKTGPNKERDIPADDQSSVVSDNDESQVTVIYLDKSQGTQPAPPPDIPDTSLVTAEQGFVMRPPLALKESFGCLDEPYFYLVIYEFDDKTDKCTGTCTLRFEMDDERIKDQSWKALQQLELRDEDIWFRDPINEPKHVSISSTQ